MKYLLLSSVLVVVGLSIPVWSYSAGGGIDSVYKYAWSENLGWINFNTTGGNVFVDDDRVTGYAWNEHTGWINLAPHDDHFVRNDGQGNLSGHAWGEGVGYVDFSGVTIDDEGFFHGYAYSDIAGQISFNCANTDTCVASDFKVKTFWKSDVIQPQPNSGGGGGGGGGSGGGSGSRATSTRSNVVPNDNGPTGHVCVPYLTEYIRYGGDNNPNEVRKLERFLNEKEGESLPVDGVYSADDVEAVKRFQEKYKSQVLDIWGLNLPTGYVYRTTVMKINSFYCQAELQCPMFTEYNRLSQNNQSEEVRRTKGLLADLGFYPWAIDDRFDLSLHNALKYFQETFRATMLDPWGIVEGTGYKYKTTNKFLNILVGCVTPPVFLEGVGMFDY